MGHGRIRWVRDWGQTGGSTGGGKECVGKERLITGDRWIWDLGSVDLEMDLGEKFVQFRSVVSGQGDGPVEGLSVARRVWTRVAEKKRGRGPRRRGEDHGGPLEGGPFTWVRDSHPSPPSVGIMPVHIIIFSLRVTHPKLDLPLPLLPV